MDAPTYPPASAYEAPVVQPHRLSARHSSLKALMDHHEAWKIVLKETPLVKVIAAAPAAAPFLGNFSLQNVVEIGFMKAEELERIDARLQALEMVR